MVIIGVRRRVSGGWIDGNAGKLCRNAEDCGELVEIDILGGF
jgi:hypothetical protein